MSDDLKAKLISIPVKILAVVIIFMILMRFIYVFYDFLQNPFHEPPTLSEEAVKHVMAALILLELFALTLRFLVHEIIDPNLILLTVLTALGRHIIVINPVEVDYARLIATGFVLAITIFGLYILKSRDSYV
ncbi:phosphate-starvation-inducible PsiE family protein [Archaeoglobus veneficus]|uniref:Uncharacterized protein n=1 Tax=Archaeoglobus veneficus (strain DSM 11195 / SNP6) TaxID=693661 RepID=F2KSK0_ARCVS|nr:phosphate-starvation-inducible PsiE family protein [Archaeoglobus veneficus]AEA48070.1 hypothetical protein Arcve_2080 [Archaeoglobus veneficus SNP6]